MVEGEAEGVAAAAEVEAAVEEDEKHVARTLRALWTIGL